MKHTDPSVLLEHLEFARRLAWSLVRDPDLGQDIAQDAYAIALESPPREPGKERAFLRSVVTRLVGRHRRSSARRAHRDRAAARPEAMPATDEIVAAMEVHKRVVDAVLELPEAYREALLLRFFDELSAQAIAARLDQPVETVRTRIKRALGLVRGRLDARPGSDRSDWRPALVALLQADGSRNAARPWRRRFLITAAAILVGMASILIVARWSGALGGGGDLYAYNDVAEPAENLTRARPAALPSSLAASLVPLGREAVDDGPDAAAVARALGLTRPLAYSEALEAPNAADYRRVREATETVVPKLRSTGLFAGEREDGSRVLFARSSVEGEEHAFVILALTGARSFIQAVVVDADGAVIEEWSHFMAGLRWHSVPRIEGARPRSHLTALAEKDVTDADEGDARLTSALLRLMHHMNEQASTFNLPKNDRPDAVDGSRMMGKEYARVAELGDDLRPLLGDSTAEFVRLATDSSAAALELARIADAEEIDMTAMQAAKGRVMGNCRACHELPMAGTEDRLKMASAELRDALGIGDGFYAVGHDLRIRHADRGRMQRVADALRQCALLLDVAAGEGK